MSKITMTTVLWYPAGSDGRPIGPRVALEGIESRFPSVKFPANGITFLYGRRNPGEAYLLKEAHRHGFSASIAEITVDIGHWLGNKIGFDPIDKTRGLEHTGFFSMVRAKKEVSDVVLSVWNKSIGLDVEDFPKRGTKYAYLFDEVMKLPQFKHLKVISYSVNSTEAGEFQVATIFDLAAIDNVACGHLMSDVEVVCDVIARISE